MSSAKAFSVGLLVEIYDVREGEKVCTSRAKIVAWLCSRPCTDKDALQFVKNHAYLTYCTEQQKWCVG